MFIRHSKGKVISAQSMFLALAALVPLMINMLTLCGVIKSEIELTPLFFAFSVIMVLVAIRRYGLLDINQIAIQDTFDNIETAAAVFDTEGNVTYRNKAMKTLVSAEYSHISELCSALSELSGEVIDFTGNSAEFSVENERYSVKKSLILNELGTEIAEIVLISNITEYFELAQTEKKLSIEHERNRIAQEIHDSAGHTFTMISSLAKITQTELKSGKFAEILQYIAEIDGLSRSGITQLRCSINNLRDDEFMTSVTRAVKTVTDAVRTVDIDVCVQGTEDSRYAFCIRQIYDSVKETVTNTMRYSSAERIDIIIKFLGDRLELYIFDNGKGCGKIKENNGLSGIRCRIEDLGGTVKFSSVEGEGFTTMIKIPVEKG
jgi:signal transduction histidine kinase